MGGACPTSVRLSEQITHRFIPDLLETNARREIKVDRHGQTGVRGIFAAGDATDSHDKQIVIAAGEGASAALAAFEYLVKQV